MAAITIVNMSAAAHAMRIAILSSRISILNYLAGTMSIICLVGSIRIPQKQIVASWSIAQCLDVSTRSRYRVMLILARLSSSAVRYAELCSPVAMLAGTNVATAGHARAQISRRKIMANAFSHVAVTTPTAGMHALLPVMVMSHVHCAMRDAKSSAATRNARRNAANHAHPALKRNVRLAAHTPSAICRVPRHATGYHVQNDARDFCNAAINVRLFVAQTARARCTVRSAHRTRSKSFELILSC